MSSVVLIGLAGIASFLQAVSIGSNDAANAIGTAVGSGSVTIQQAISWAVVFECLGVVLAGQFVSSTIRSALVPPAVFPGGPAGIFFATGMLSVLLSSGLCVAAASFWAIPVSGTHAVIASVLGFSIAGLGRQSLGAINWGVLGRIALSWVVSPLTGAFLASLLYRALLRFILLPGDTGDRRCQRVLPYLYFFLAGLFAAFIALSSPLLIPLGAIVLGPAVAFLALASFFSSRRWIVPYHLNRYKRLVAIQVVEMSSPPPRRTEQAGDDPDFPLDDETTLVVAVGSPRALPTPVAVDSEEQQQPPPSSPEGSPNSSDEQIRVELAPQGAMTMRDELFRGVQFIACMLVAFGHGSNDVANAVGPLAAIVEPDEEEAVPLYVLLVGALGIGVGLLVYGAPVVATVGSKITALSPPKGFAAQFGAAITIILSSRLALPISTSAVIVGSVAGVAMVREHLPTADTRKVVDMKVLGTIFLSWVLTIPIAATLAGLIFITLRFIFLF